ncbi:MAG: hypothetical protein ChlgKO_08840 [Chlamydiales bacterium]
MCIIAWALIKKGSYSSAFKKLTTAAAIDESSPMVAYFCGVVNEKRHFNNRAIENFKKCIEQLRAAKALAPHSKILHALGADNLINEAERHINDLAKKSLAAAAIPQPTEESQINQLVWQIEKRGLISKTIEVEINELKKIVLEHPDSISAKKALIKLFQKNGIQAAEDWKLTLSQLEMIMSSCPSEVEPILYYCSLFQKIQIAREARGQDEVTSISDHIIHYLNKASSINPQDYRTLQLLVKQHSRKKDYLFSRKCLKKAIKEYLQAQIVRKRTTVEWYDDLKRLCNVEDPNSSLVKFIVQKIESNPLDSDLVWIFNHIFERSERNRIQTMSSMISDRALLDLEEIENDPVKQISENYENVLKWINASLAIKPYNPSDCYYALSKLYKLEGKIQEQKDALEKSYSNCPSYKCGKELTNLGYSKEDLENLITKRGYQQG